MKRRVFIAGLGAVVIAPCAVDAQQAEKLYRIGVLAYGALPTFEQPLSAFKDTLRQLGYIEGQNFLLEIATADGNAQRLPALARELVSRRVDVIVTGNPITARAAKEATRTIPIVMAGVGSPASLGLIDSLAKPGGNVTGVAGNVGEGFSSKRLEIIREIRPQAVRLAVLWHAGSVDSQAQFNEVQGAARGFGMTVHSVDFASKPPEITPAQITAGRSDAIVVIPGPFIFAERHRILNLVTQTRLPAVYPYREFTDAGGLLSYGTNLAEQFRRAAGYVDKILKGANPADLPVEQPTKFSLVINLKTAKALGLTIPPSLLLRADQIIE